MDLGKSVAPVQALLAPLAAHLQVDTPGSYTFEVHASSPVVLIVDDRSFRILRYVEKSSAAVACLLWQPPGSSPSIIPMRALSPLDPEEYARLLPQLPFP